MSKSYAQMADEILNGALTDKAKNPYDPATGHQASMPAMDPNDRLIEMNDNQRNAFIKGLGSETKEVIVEQQEAAPTLQITAQELQILDEAKKIITKIQEATTVGNIGVSYASTGQGGNPKSVKVPGNVNVSAAPKKRTKKVKPKKKDSNDFLSYLKA